MWNILAITTILGISVLVQAQVHETPSPVGLPKYSLPSPPDCGIVEEADSSSGEWPWIVAIGSEKSFFCTGSIISERHILTSAYCVAGWETLRVGLRDFDRPLPGHVEHDVNSTIIQVEKTFIHPEWTEGIYKYDIAVLTLEEDIEFTDLIKPICLPTYDDASNGSYVWTVGSVAGWGDLSKNGQLSSGLLNTRINIWETLMCEDDYMGIKGGFSEMYSVCADNLPGSKGPCWTDYGSPLMIQQNGTYNIIGLYPYIHDNTCAVAGIPSMFTSTNPHLEWIASNLY